MASIEQEFANPDAYGDSQSVVARIDRHKALKDSIKKLTDEWEKLSVEEERLRADFEAALAQLEQE